MALGTLGSTLNDELNRLANGGTYRDKDDMVDEALAAKQWANSENIIPYSTDTVGILNEIAGLGLDKRNWLDFNGVCNYIAGTTGLPAAAALRQVYPTTDLLTGVASYYVDAIQPTNWGSLGYVRLNGVPGNYLSVPSATNLNITGALDIRAYLAPSTWTPSAETAIITKYDYNGNKRQYRLGWHNGNDFNKLSLGISTAGTTANINSLATANVPFSANEAGWVRVTYDPDTGAGQYAIIFYTSTDGTNWTQLGTTVTGASVAATFTSDAPVFIGAIGNPTTFTGSLTANLYRAQVLNGIGGTTVLDVNIATDWPSSNLTFFTATTGQTVTVNGVGVVNNLGAAGSLLPTTVGSSTAADSNDPKFLDHTGTNYVYLPGVAGNNMTVPDAAALDITGDIDVRVYLAADDWTPSATSYLLSKWQASPQYSWRFGLLTTGVLTFVWVTDGTVGTVRFSDSTASVPFADGQSGWVRATLDVDNGASGADVKFFTSTDGTNWTQLGTTRTGAGTTSIFSGTSQVEIGSQAGASNLAGKVLRSQIFNGIDGTKVLDVDTSVLKTGAETSFTALTGQTVTINRSTSGRKTVAVTQPCWLFGTDDYMEVNNRYMTYTAPHLYLPGIAGNYASTPDAAALDITGDIDLRCKVALDDWTPSANQSLITKSSGSSNISYRFYVKTDGKLEFAWSPTGTAAGIAGITSTVATGITDGATKWVRVTFDMDNGASGKTATFYTSDDGTAWTQLGTVVTSAGTTSLYSGTASVDIGTRDTGTGEIARGKFFRAQVLNGIDGTVAFDANFETSITSLLQTTFTESSTNAATVTINRSGSTYRSAGITAAGYLYPGATNAFSASATNFLDFGAADSLTVLASVRYWGTPAGSTRVVFKGSTGPRYGVLLNSTTASFLPFDGTNTGNVSTNLPVAGSQAVYTGILNRATGLSSIYSNTTSNSISGSAIGSLLNIDTLRVGSGVSAQYLDGEIYAAAVFRRALTSAEITLITNYFNRRSL